LGQDMRGAPPVEPACGSGVAFEELTVVVGRALRLASIVLDIVSRSPAHSRSSREQMETSDEQ